MDNYDAYSPRTVEPTPLENSTLTENEKKSLFFHHLRKRSAHNGKIKAAQNAKKTDGKTAQADGIVLGDLDFAIKSMDADDKVTVTDRFVAHGQVLSWLHIIPGFQSDLLRDRAPAIDRIENQGELAGLAAKDRGSEYPEGSDEDEAWLRGYDRGQKIMRDNLETAMTKINSKAAEEDEGDEPDFPDDDDGEFEANEARLERLEADVGDEPYPDDDDNETEE